ncbi:hypothetical protein IG193_00560 [Infirmifilum lucidum]|uniref:Uncharacterized protein n=1 Tax=Infirmifilum lucidum TaxID=2776706 RepID=A0A7L9FI01_9CREN|nr:hypothetical protein [Infirmifilum lucidum]QOJ78992.1 hypothetical protein IG193_00560 [Infirmifilum lucidum]
MTSCEEQYDTWRRPPAPRVRVTLVNPVSGDKVEVMAYVDTGFDGSLLLTAPLWERLRLGLIEMREDVYAVHAGSLPVRLQVALASMSVCGLFTLLTRVYMHPLLKWPLLGREILNRLLVELRGPELRVRVSQPL